MIVPPSSIPGACEEIHIEPKAIESAIGRFLQVQEVARDGVCPLGSVSFKGPAGEIKKTVLNARRFLLGAARATRGDAATMTKL